MESETNENNNSIGKTQWMSTGKQVMNSSSHKHIPAKRDARKPYRYLPGSIKLNLSKDIIKPDKQYAESFRYLAGLPKNDLCTSSSYQAQYKTLPCIYPDEMFRSMPASKLRIGDTKYRTTPLPEISSSCESPQYSNEDGSDAPVYVSENHVQLQDEMSPTDTELSVNRSASPHSETAGNGSEDEMHETVQCKEAIKHKKPDKPKDRSMRSSPTMLYLRLAENVYKNKNNSTNNNNSTHEMRRSKNVATTRSTVKPDESQKNNRRSTTPHPRKHGYGKSPAGECPITKVMECNQRAFETGEYKAPAGGLTTARYGKSTCSVRSRNAQERATENLQGTVSAPDVSKSPGKTASTATDVKQTGNSEKLPQIAKTTGQIKDKTKHRKDENDYHQGDKDSVQHNVRKPLSPQATNDSPVEKTQCDTADEQAVMNDISVTGHQVYKKAPAVDELLKVTEDYEALKTKMVLYEKVLATLVSLRYSNSAYTPDFHIHIPGILTKAGQIMYLQGRIAGFRDQEKILKTRKAAILVSRSVRDARKVTCGDNTDVNRKNKVRPADTTTLVSDSARQDPQTLDETLRQCSLHPAVVEKVHDATDRSNSFFQLSIATEAACNEENPCAGSSGNDTGLLDAAEEDKCLMQQYKEHREMLEELELMIPEPFNFGYRKATLYEKMAMQAKHGREVPEEQLPESGEYLEERITHLEEGSDELNALLKFDRFGQICILYRYLGEELIRLQKLTLLKTCSRGFNDDLNTPTLLDLACPKTPASLKGYKGRLRSRMRQLATSGDTVGEICLNRVSHKPSAASGSDDLDKELEDLFGPGSDVRPRTRRGRHSCPETDSDGSDELDDVTQYGYYRCPPNTGDILVC